MAPRDACPQPTSDCSLSCHSETVDHFVLFGLILPRQHPTSSAQCTTLLPVPGLLRHYKLTGAAQKQSLEVWASCPWGRPSTSGRGLVGRCSRHLSFGGATLGGIVYASLEVQVEQSPCCPRWQPPWHAFILPFFPFFLSSFTLLASFAASRDQLYYVRSSLCFRICFWSNPS